MKGTFLGLVFASLLLVSARSQGQPPRIDSTYSLLSNPYVQLESTEAINDMYNFRFERSMRHFNYLKKQYGWHPLPYFMMGLNYYWRILPAFKNEEYDDEFLAYMDSSIVLAKRLYEKYNHVEGAFFLAAANAFKGNLYSERHDWGKATVAGRNALKYLEECKGRDDLSPELLYGDALFNYYAVWIPEHYPILKPVIKLFPEGDRELGIEQLKTVARNAFYTRTEAQYFLMRIAYQENDFPTALQVAEYLNKTFPDNAYFHRYYARLLYQTGQYDKALRTCKSILNRIDSAQVGYEYNSGRYASFFMGYIYELRRDFEPAKKYLKLSMEYAEAADATDLGYYQMAVLHLGRIAERQGNNEEAKDYYKSVKKLAKRGDSAYEEAKDKLKKL